MLGILEKIIPSELVSNGYISNHNKVRRPHPKFKVSFYLYFCCFWINVTQINFENIKRKIQRIISDSCFQLKSWFNFDARAPSIPLLNFPFNSSHSRCQLMSECPDTSYLWCPFLWPITTSWNLCLPFIVWTWSHSLLQYLENLWPLHRSKPSMLLVDWGGGGFYLFRASTAFPPPPPLPVSFYMQQ